MPRQLWNENHCGPADASPSATSAVLPGATLSQSTAYNVSRPSKAALRVSVVPDDQLPRGGHLRAGVCPSSAQSQCGRGRYGMPPSSLLTRPVLAYIICQARPSLATRASAASGPHVPAGYKGRSRAPCASQYAVTGSTSDQAS